ncbi:MAG: guanylate kinase [Chloroflexi bacterium]|nr:guanylate kinase [Chloroflexota bacterium]MDA0244146.1 guanylate kinase [Chloroflexota bacterium]
MNSFQEYAELVRDGNPYERPTHPLIVVISGPSGVGKDTVVQEMLRRNHNFYFVVTATSRPPRRNEVHGVDYYFVTEESFRHMIAAGEMLEHAWVHDNFKGVPKQQIRDALASGRDVLMRVDPQGAATLKALMPSAVFIFLMAESEEAMARRLRDRRSDTAEAVQLRLAIARQEMQRIPEFDYCVINREGELTQTIAQIENIIEAARHRTDTEPTRI